MLLGGEICAAVGTGGRTGVDVVEDGGVAIVVVSLMEVIGTLIAIQLSKKDGHFPAATVHRSQRRYIGRGI